MMRRHCNAEFGFRNAEFEMLKGREIGRIENQGIGVPGYQDNKKSGYPEIRISGYQNIRIPGDKELGNQSDQDTYFSLCGNSKKIRVSVSDNFVKRRPPLDRLRINKWISSVESEAE
jgi:hypothetical protein